MPYTWLHATIAPQLEAQQGRYAAARLSFEAGASLPGRGRDAEAGEYSELFNAYVATPYIPPLVPPHSIPPLATPHTATAPWPPPLVPHGPPSLPPLSSPRGRYAAFEARHGDLDAAISVLARGRKDYPKDASLLQTLGTLQVSPGSYAILGTICHIRDHMPFHALIICYFMPSPSSTLAITPTLTTHPHHTPSPHTLTTHPHHTPSP